MHSTTKWASRNSGISRVRSVMETRSHRGHEQAAHGRRDHAQRQVDDDHHGKVRGIYAQGEGDGRQYGHQNHHAGQRLHEDSEDQQQNVHGNQEHDGREFPAHDQLGQILRNAFYGQHPGKGRRGASSSTEAVSMAERARMPGTADHCSVR